MSSTHQKRASASLSLAKEFASPATRRALLALCHACTRDRESAEDLVQETLLESLRRAETLARPEAWRPWLFGVARNVCRRWREDRQRDLGKFVYTEDVEILPVRSDKNVTSQKEVGQLLESAMQFLSVEARLLTRAVYLEEMPHAEAAIRFGLSPNMVAVRLHRYRQILHRILTSDPSLREMASEYGLFSPCISLWRQTAIWCRWCGQSRMQVRCRYSEKHSEQGCLAEVEVFCPGCNPHRFPLADATTRNTSFLLGRVRGYKTALKRLNIWLGSWYAGATGGAAMPCWNCGQVSAHLLPAPSGKLVANRTRHPVYVFCSSCRHEMFASPSGIALHSAALRQFTEKHERIRILPEKEVKVQGQSALLIGFESLGMVSGKIHILLKQDTFALLHSEVL